MRHALLLAALLLAGCFDPVGPALRGDAALDPADAGMRPDAGALACTSASQCPAPVSGDPVCAPLLAVCEGGRCASRPAPRLWDGHPGACNLPEHCACQKDLLPPACVGSWLCVANQCAWKCGGCLSDLECPSGEVCEAPGCGQPKACVPGCRESSSCPGDEICGQLVQPACGESYGQCVQPPGCERDAQCPRGTVCDWVPGTGRKACQAGCHDDLGCAAGEACVFEECARCLECPCVGRCEPTAGCSADAECPAGSVCATSFERCEPHCLPGCRTDAQCRTDEQCAPPPPCAGCGCDHGGCVPRPAGCASKADCAAGETCTFEDPFRCSGERRCVAGCLADGECAAGQRCELADCGPCCPGRCVAAGGCAIDSDCPAGEVCEPAGPGCSARRCVPGCHSSAQCAAGESCLLAPCLTCPCPGSCQSAVCPMWEPACSGATDCSWHSSFCEGGCCRPCPVFDAPACPPGECASGVGLDERGCPRGPVCGPCCACPDVVAPVCSEAYQTYSNLCELQCAGARLLHAGPCEQYEGLACPASGVCPGGMYCRDSCPICDWIAVTRCTKRGACVDDWDCPAGLPEPICSTGPTKWACLANVCVASCP